jgi:SAM-dependent methyltransferase
VGCGPGTTSLSLATRRPDASILGCDLSEALVAIAVDRASSLPNVRFVAEDAEQAARANGPFKLIFSRHGVMFFADPHRAFRTLHEATAEGGRLVFSCFRSWDENPWAAELASAAAGTALPPPGREPSGFAFADPDYVQDILSSAGWADAEPEPVDFSYVAGEGPEAIEQALDFLTELGPASRVLEGMEGGDRDAAVERVREAIAGHLREGRVTFSSAAWIWRAAAS